MRAHGAKRSAPDFDYGLRSPWLRAGIAVVAVLAAVALRQLAAPELGPIVPFIYFYPALIVATWFGRWTSGLLALALSAWMSVPFLEPLGTFTLAGPRGYVALGSFLLVGGTIVAAIHVLQTSRQRASILADRTAEIVENFTEGFCVLDRQLRFLSANGEAERLLARSRRDLLGQELTSRVALDGPAMTRLRRAIEHRTTESFEAWDSGVGRWLALRAFPVEEGLALVLEDVSDRKEAERTRRLLASIVESSDDAMISVGADGRILTWNPGAERLFGYAASEALGQRIAMLLPAGREDDFDRALAAVRSGERVEHYESQRARKDGSIVEVSLAVSPMRDEQGAIVGVSKVARDVTAAREREREEARTRELFLGMLGHDLRAPLNGLTVNAELLRRSCPPESAQFAAWIVQNAERMGRMIDQLMDLTRSRLGTGIPLKTEEVSLRDVWLGVIGDLLPDDAARVSFSGPPEIYGSWDADRLAQVFANLVGNALDHGSSDAPVSVRTSASHGAAIVEVANRGDPIPETLRPAIFEPFRRGHTSGRRRGLGLGLYIAREIVRAHGGSIELAVSNPQTVFRVTLPLRPAPPA